jgi:carbonic anhydrase
MPTEKILAGLDRFYQGFEDSSEPSKRPRSMDHAPDVLFIGCSDARVPVELLAQLDPGALFVTRNVGNIVPPYGTGQMAMGAVIEYAVLHLHVKHIVIVGHTDCGSIKALDAPPDWSQMPHIARWIEHARPAKTKVEASGLPEDNRHLATVRENVLQQLENLRSYDPVHTRERSETLTLHGWVYHLETGRLEAYDPEAGSWRPLASS